MTLNLYMELKKIASAEFSDIVMGTEIIFASTGRVRKLRITLIDETFIDVWYSAEGEYSFHWEQGGIREYVYRHDNAPHKKWNYVSTFPKHCHEGSEEKVVESKLPDDPNEALMEFLKIVRRLMRLKKET